MKNSTTITREQYTSMRSLAADAEVPAEGLAELRRQGVTAPDAEIHATFQASVARLKTQSFEEFTGASVKSAKPKSARLAVDSGEDMRAGWPSGGQWGGTAGIGIGDAILGSIGYLF